MFMFGTPSPSSTIGTLLEGHFGDLRGGLHDESWSLSPKPAVNQALFHRTLGREAAQGGAPMA